MAKTIIKVDQHKCIKLLQAHFKKTGRIPVKNDFADQLDAFVSIFGTWKKGLVAAGLKVVSSESYSKAQLKKSLLDFYAKHHKSPKASDCKKVHGLCAPKNYFRAFNVGTWTEVLFAVGLEANKLPTPNEEELTKRLLDFHKRYNKVPSTKDCLLKNGLINYQTITRVFGVCSWMDVLGKIGLECPREFGHSKAKLKNSLLNFYMKHKRAPLTIECTKANGLYDKDIYIKNLEVDNWAGVLKLVGLERFLFKSPITDDHQTALTALVRFVKKEKITHAEDYKLVYRKHNMPSLGYIHKELGGWRLIMEQAGLRVNIDRDRLIKGVIEFYKEHEKSPTREELAQKLRITPDRVSTITGSYNSFLKWLGLPINVSIVLLNQETKDKLIKIYMDFSLKNNYRNGATLKAVNQAEGMPNSNVFVKQFGSFTDLRRACGYKIFEAPNAKYSKKGILMMLRKEYLVHKRTRTTKELRANLELPCITSIKHYLKVRTLPEIWELVIKEL